MLIEQFKRCKMHRYNVKVGLRVVTVRNLHDAKSIGLEEESHNYVRKSNEKGIVEECTAVDGYFWWIRHNDNTVGVYGFDEFNPAEGYFYAIDYFWRDREFLKVGRIISSKPEILEEEVHKLTKGEPFSISAMYGPFETEYAAQAASGPFFGRDT